MLTRDVGDTVHEAHAHALGALALGYLGRLAEAEAELAAAGRLLDRADNPSIRAMCAYVAGEMLVDVAPGQALQHLQDSRAMARAVDNDFIAAIAGVSAVSCAARVGDPSVTIGQYRDVISSFRRGGTWPQLWTTLRSLVEALARTGRDSTRRSCSAPSGRPVRVRRSAAPTPSASQQWTRRCVLASETPGSTPCSPRGERWATRWPWRGRWRPSTSSADVGDGDGADAGGILRFAVAVAGSLDGDLSSTAWAWLSTMRVKICWAYPSTIE